MENQTIKFKDRQTEVWVYPRISVYSNEIDNSEFLSFLNEKPTKNLPINLYIHIPFCNSFCFFCPYYKVRYNGYKEENKELFMNSLLAELEMYSKTEYFKNAQIGSIYFGGGDGALLELKYLDKILKFVKSNFNVVDEVAVSLEGHVWSLTDREKLAWFKSVGGQHISFGVQTFKESIRKKVFLKPTHEEIKKLAALLKEFEINDFAIDLIYNFPEQTLEDVAEDLRKAVELDPEYIDVHNLNVYPNTKFEKYINEGKYFDDKPTSEKEVQMYEFIMNELPKYGYKQVGSIFFSKVKSKPFRTFIRQSRNYPVLGVGPSARTYLEKRSYRDVCSVDKYCEELNKKGYPIEAGNIATDQEDQDRMMVFFPQLGWIEKKYIPDDKEVYEKIALLERSGYVEWKGDTLYLTYKGRIYCGNVASLFFSDNQRKNNLKTFLKSMTSGTNPYNQDLMGV